MNKVRGLKKLGKKIIPVSVSLVLLAIPLLSLAFNAGSVPSTTNSLDVNQLIDILLNFIWPIIVAFIIIMFIAIGLLFMTAQGDPGKIDQARKAVMGGIAIVVIILIAFSIVFVIRNQLGV